MLKMGWFRGLMVRSMLLIVVMLLSAISDTQFGASAVSAQSAEQLEGQLRAQSSQNTQPKQDKSALAVSPAIFEHVLEPGVPKPVKLRVTNLTNFPLPISGTVKSFVALEEIEDPAKQALYDASKWFAITEPDFILQPKQTREVSLTIVPPPDSEPGGHYATVYFQPLLPAGALTPSTAYLSARVGSLAFLIMPGELDEKLAAPNFSTQGWHNSSPVGFELKLENTGNVHLAPNGVVQIKSMFGKKIGEAELQPGVILPGTQKVFASTWDKPLSFGRYTAEVELTYGTEQKTLRVEQAVFWIIPWTIVALLIIAIPMLLIAVRTRGRWKLAWKILRGKA
jgi:hypothetical protein